MSEEEHAYYYCNGDERLAVAIVAQNRKNYMTTSMRTPEALQAIEQAKKYLHTGEGNAQALQADLSVHLSFDDPFFNDWLNARELRDASDESLPSKCFTKYELAEALGIPPSKAYGLADGLLALGVIAKAGTRRKEGSTGRGATAYAFSSELMRRLARALGPLQ
jgi:hypothetical protein